MMFDGTRCKLKPDDFVEEARLFFQKLHDNPNHRFRSWEHCYEAFQEAFELKDKGGKPNIDLLCLHLAFYLASWGMYRGSTFLLDRDYLVHREAVAEILKDDYRELRGISADRLGAMLKASGRSLSNLVDNLNEIYQEISRVKKEVSLTLLTKILLGTFGCTPAYDRYLKAALREKGFAAVWTRASFWKSLSELAEYYQANSELFDVEVRRMRVGASEELYYPPMKFMDMGLWTIGNEIEEQKKIRKS